MPPVNEVNYALKIYLVFIFLRLTISGSSAMPIPVRDQWKMLTNHVMLERYGMSEILMALTQPMREARVAGRHSVCCKYIILVTIIRIYCLLTSDVQ